MGKAPRTVWCVGFGDELAAALGVGFEAVADAVVREAAENFARAAGGLFGYREFRGIGDVAWRFGWSHGFIIAASGHCGAFTTLAPPESGRLEAAPPFSRLWGAKPSSDPDYQIGNVRDLVIVRTGSRRC